MGFTRALCVSIVAFISALACDQGSVGEKATDISPMFAIDLSSVDSEVREFLVQQQNNAKRDLANAQAIGELAIAYEMNGYPDAALVGYEHATKIDPSNPWWPYFQSLVLASQGQFERSLAMIEQALDIEPNYSAGWIWKGRWHLELNDLRQAKQAFQTAVKIDASNAGVVGLAKVALRAGANEEALDLLQKLAATLSHPQIDHLQYQANTRLGLVDANHIPPLGISPGEVGFRDPWSDEKRSFEVSISAELTRFRTLLQHSQQSSQAFAVIDALYEKHPHSERVTIAKVHSVRLRNNLSLLRTLLEASHARWPDQSIFTVGLAELEMDQGNLRSASKLLDSVLTREPRNAWALQQRGILLAQQGDFAKAIAMLQDALAIEKTSATHFYLANAHAEFKDWKSVGCHLSRALELDPTFDAALNQLQRLQELQGVDFLSQLAVTDCTQIGGI